ncbi:MAG: omptin family outer membrane protease [Treponema sp.]
MKKMYRQLCSAVWFFITGFCFAYPLLQNHSGTAHIQKKKLEITAGFSCDVTAASAWEYVLQEGRILSELQWDLLPSAAYSGHFTLKTPHGIHIQGRGSYLQPMKTAPMTDKDFEKSFSSDITKFSEHPCTITGGWRFAGKIGIQKEIPLPQKVPAGISLFIEPQFSIRYSKISWFAKDGYLQYALNNSDGTFQPWHPHLPKKYIKGDAISYTQELLIPAFGIGLTAHFPYHLQVYTDIHISSDIMGIAEDTHFMRNQRFVDYTRNGTGIYWDTRILWSFFRNTALIAGCHYEYSKSMNGRTLGYDGLDSTTPAHVTEMGTSGVGVNGCSFLLGIMLVFGVY